MNRLEKHENLGVIFKDYRLCIQLNVAIKHIDSFQVCSFLNFLLARLSSRGIQNKKVQRRKMRQQQGLFETLDVWSRNNLRKTYQTKQILVHKINHFWMVTQRSSQRCVTTEITAAKETSITNTAKRKHSKVKNSTHDLSLSSLRVLLCVVSTWASA